MKARELRIGNYIIQDGEIIKVCLNWFAAKDMDMSTVKNSKPIPLTEDWLLKFGFEWKNHAMCLGNFCIRKQIDGWMFYVSNESYNKTIHLEHVHQLQNLYFALTNKELKINTK